MPTTFKKTRSAGRFGPRYGKDVRERLVAIERKQRKKQKCHFCGSLRVKRISKGIWHCKKCGRKFASDTFYLEEK